MTCRPCLPVVVFQQVTQSFPTIYFSLFLSCPFLSHRRQDRCKACHFNPFEFFDHGVLQKHTEKEFTMN